MLPKNFTIKKPNILNISICVNEKSASSYYLHDVLNKKKYDFSKYLLFYGKLSFDVLFDVCKLPSGPNIPVSSFFTPSPIHIGSLTSATVLTKTTLIDARIGQGKYRNELMRLYGKKCMVTKINNTDFLIASHIKP
ncbi:hypothetical protein FACS189496_2330 [Bacilli bacterium]|nr:hypothetical protein FACS189496_2330 [Bacilli bacterium]